MMRTPAVLLILEIAFTAYTSSGECWPLSKPHCIRSLRAFIHAYEVQRHILKSSEISFLRSFDNSYLSPDFDFKLAD